MICDRFRVVQVKADALEGVHAAQGGRQGGQEGDGGDRLETDRDDSAEAGDAAGQQGGADGQEQCRISLTKGRFRL